MRRIVLLLAGLFALSTGAVAGELFRWVDENGKVHYGDAPPAKAKTVRKKFGGVEQSEEVSYEARRAQQNFPVALYVTHACAEPCIHARALLRKRGVPFSEKVLKTQEEMDAFYKLSGSGGVPTLMVGKTYLKSFQEAKWNSELDLAGYPKEATYRQRISPTKPAASEEEPANNQATAESQPAEGQATEEQAASAETPAE